MSSRKTLSLAAGIVALILYFVGNNLPSSITHPISAASPASAGNNSLSVFVEPESSIKPVLDLIHSASASIDMVMYQLDDTSVEQALVDKSAHGITVRVLLNGGYYGTKENTSNDAAYTFLKEHGVQVEWSPAYFALTHQKSIVVDGSKALIMTFNLTPKYYSTGREFGVIDTDSSDVSAIESAFASDWKGSQTNTSPGTDLVWSPGSKAALLSLIQGATKTLDIYNEEMADKDIILALALAGSRGVTVRVTMTYATSWKDAFTSLSSSKVAVRTFAANAPLYIHAKAVVADNAQVFIGSENFSANSMNKNRELGLITSNPAVIQYVEQVFEHDWQDARSFK